MGEWSLPPRGRVARSQIALVAQDDCLLQGTIAENISGFDEQTDMQLVRVCAELAQIRTDIERMPMGYESLVGDMGSLHADHVQQPVPQQALGSLSAGLAGR